MGMRMGMVGCEGWTQGQLARPFECRSITVSQYQIIVSLRTPKGVGWVLWFLFYCFSVKNKYFVIKERAKRSKVKVTCLTFICVLCLWASGAVLGKNLGNMTKFRVLRYVFYKRHSPAPTRLCAVSLAVSVWVLF